jgi:hypothetical protein
MPRKPTSVTVGPMLLEGPRSGEHSLKPLHYIPHSFSLTVYNKRKLRKAPAGRGNTVRVNVLSKPNIYLIHGKQIASMSNSQPSSSISIRGVTRARSEPHNARCYDSSAPGTVGRHFCVLVILLNILKFIVTASKHFGKLELPNRNLGCVVPRDKTSHSRRSSPRSASSCRFASMCRPQFTREDKGFPWPLQSIFGIFPSIIHTTRICR